MRRVVQTLGWMLVAALAGCGGAKGPQTSSVTPTLPPCAQSGPAVSLPPEFPGTFPLPAGTVITSVGSAGPGAVRVEGLAPQGLKEAVAFFVQGLPAAGFKLGEGEAETGEAETRFSGKGYAGYLKMRLIPDCPGAVTLTIIISKYK